MAIYTNLPVYKSAYSLLLALSSMMPGLSRDCRYTLGQELRRRVMDIILLVYRANRSKRKAQVIEQMREALLEVQVYIRLMCDLKYISEKQYIALVEHTSSISKQLVAWGKSDKANCNNKNNEYSDGNAVFAESGENANG